jgi:hypothetical protein
VLSKGQKALMSDARVEGVFIPYRCYQLLHTPYLGVQMTSTFTLKFSKKEPKMS